MKLLTESQKSRLIEIIRPIVMETENKNSLDNRLYVALSDLARLCSYLSNPKAEITNQTVLDYQQELSNRYKKVENAIRQYTK